MAGVEAALADVVIIGFPERPVTVRSRSQPGIVDRLPSDRRILLRLLTLRPVLHRTVGAGQVVRGIDYRDMRESLGIVAQLAPRVDVVFLCKQADVIAQSKQPDEELAGFVMPTL
jgi:hypothetical protein